jgi:hypothetical protein
MPPATRLTFSQPNPPAQSARARGQIIIVAVCLLSVVKLDGAANADAAAASHTIKVDALLFLSSQNRRQAHAAHVFYMRESHTRLSRHLHPSRRFYGIAGDAFLSLKLPTDEIILPCDYIFSASHDKILLLTHPRKCCKHTRNPRE